MDKDHQQGGIRRCGGQAGHQTNRNREKHAEKRFRILETRRQLEFLEQVDMQTLIHSSLRMEEWKKNLDTVLTLADEFEELNQQRKEIQWEKLPKIPKLQGVIRCNELILFNLRATNIVRLAQKMYVFVPPNLYKRGSDVDTSGCLCFLLMPLAWRLSGLRDASPVSDYGKQALFSQGTPFAAAASCPLLCPDHSRRMLNFYLTA
ncbi:uncharacterized protein LOC121467356 [Drosophila elegans]|uniref:uncharacterized protein LOC121467356 n=1 Tax=Drosophila elegans TaxID=30023 RepID=UPI001BC8434D|nr:uncharacterized protein LOC121467356 [Drosophila elegans]